MSSHWDQLKQAVYQHVQDHTTLTQLEQIVIQEWQAMPMHKVHRLIHSMTIQTRECIV